MKRQFLFTICVVLALAASLIGTRAVSAQTIAASTRLATSLAPQLQVDRLRQGLAAEAIGDPTITVNSLDDEFNTDGDCSLEEAIIAANTNAAVDACTAGIPGTDTINFSVIGTIDTGLPGGFIPSIITEDLIIAGPGAGNLMITNRMLPDTHPRLLEVNAGVALSLQDLTIASTGGIHNSGTLVVSNSTFSDNVSPINTNGGAIQGGTVTVENSTFSGNQHGLFICPAPDPCYGRGGAIDADSVTVANSTFSNNNSEMGGAIFANTVSGTKSTFSDNGAEMGGAVYIDMDGLSPSEMSESIFSNNHVYNDGGAIFNRGRWLTITGSTFSDNRASSARAGNSGGAIYNDNARSITIRDSIFSHNQADFYGGAIDVVETDVANSSLIVDSTFSGNQAGSGGAIASTGSTDFPVEITIGGSTFFANSAVEGGAFFSGVGPATVLNSTFSSNSANMGSSLFAGDFSRIGLRNTIIANGLGGNNCSGVIADDGYNLQHGNPSNDSCGESIPVADPLLGPLADNGGPTLTHALLPGSPAIDAIPLAGCMDNDGNPISSDQRGVPRPQDGDGDGIALCDIGAFEVGVFPPTVVASGPYNVNEGASVTVTATGSDPEEGTLTYAWDLDNDGSFETPGKSATFSAANLDGPGTHTIAVQVTNSGGLKATDQATVNVLNVAPTAILTITPSTLLAGQSATLSFSNPFDPSAADTAAGFRYSYDCTNDGTFELEGALDASYACPYPAGGTFTALGRIADKDGSFNDYTVEVVVPGGPTITVNTSADNTTADSFCSLREAITNANNDSATYPDCAAGAGTDTIGFAANYTITLIGSQFPAITSTLVINGNGPANTILQANTNPDTATYRVFEVANTGNLTLANLTVRHGRCNDSCPTSASSGGGIYNNDGTLTVTNSTLSANSAGDFGGGILNFNGGTLTVTNSTFSANSGGYGGGIYNGGMLALTNSTFFANSASPGFGGGLYNGYIMTVTNSTLSANSAGNGGAIGNGGTLTVTNSTLSANSAANGGGIYHMIGAGTLSNSIVANSSSGLDCAQAGSGTFIADSYNLDTDGSCDNATQRTTAEINLQPLADNGGPTQTMALATDSLAIDTGANATCTPTDQRGITRPQGSHCDIGAFEYGNMTTPAVLSITRVDANPTKASHVGFTVTFSEAVSDVNPSDFNLRATSDITGAGLTSVSGVGSTYLVTVSTGSYKGSNAGLIDINSATASQLETLPGIGPTIAQQIIDYRTLNGPFFEIDEIMNVPGIGPGNFQIIRDLITAGGPFLRLDAVDDDTIKNGNNIPLGGPGLGNGSFTSGEVYRLIRKNGSDTTGVFRPSNGIIFLKNSNTTGFADVAINYGIPGDDPVVGDWDGDGTVTIGVYRKGYFYLRNSNTVGFADWVFAFGQPGDQPIAGDWNGDGIDTIGVYRPSNGQFLLRNSNSDGTADVSFYLGNVGDVGIAGDWDGDGMDTTGVFRPTNGIVYLKNKNETGFADVALNYGIPGDKPVLGDWNNDGIDTIGVYRNGLFYLRNENTSGFAEIVFGLGNPGDMPIAGNWDGIP